MGKKLFALTPEDESKIDSASEDELRIVIRDSGIAKCSILASMQDDAGVQAAERGKREAREKFKEVAGPFLEDAGREQAKIDAAYQRLVEMGKAE